MAIREYIGARYVPRFLGTYDATQVYEALDVVDNGLGTSYIAKVPTPAGTPLTNTTYWAIYGAISGAIINLQNQIDDINHIIESGYVNVLSLGVKNDGTEDCSTIINANANTPLYFPAGTYRFDSTLNLSHSIKGEGVPKSWKLNKFHGTVFNFTSDNSDSAIVYAGNANEECKEIENISIQLHGTGTGIDLNTTNCVFYIHDISILNVKTIGIYAHPTEFSSRFLQINNVDIWGVYASPTAGSIGIKLDSTAYDSFIEDIYIMGLQTGLDIGADNCAVTGGHIWCGGGTNDASYYNSTRCINIRANGLMVSDIYLDNAVVLIGGLGGSVTITNSLAYWGSVQNIPGVHAPTIFGNVNTNAIWSVDNFVVTMSFNNFTLANNPENIKGSPIINGIEGYTNFSYNLAVKCSEKNNSYDLNCAVANGQYIEVARIQYYSSILVNLGNWLMLITGRGIGGGVEYIKIGTGVNVFFKDANGYLKIYVYLPGDWKCRVTALTDGCVNPTYNLFNNSKITYDQQEDTTGLSAATEKQWINP